MIDLKKVIQGKKLNDSEIAILEYIIENMDSVLEKGVRTIAKENYTSPASVMRLSKKMGYSGFIDMYYQLLPLVKTPGNVQRTDSEKGSLSSSVAALLDLNGPHTFEQFSAVLDRIDNQYIFIYATGFSGIVGEYMYKKFLVNGKKVIYASGTDSIAVLESNVESAGLFIAISKSGETKQVIDKIKYCKNNHIPVVAFTNEIKNTASELADIVFKIIDKQKLDDRNMNVNFFFAETLLLFEYALGH